jgi:hypothetical protein
VILITIPDTRRSFGEAIPAAETKPRSGASVTALASVCLTVRTPGLFHGDKFHADRSADFNRLIRGREFAGVRIDFEDDDVV